MATLLNPYLAFTREAREAMNFYHGVFGGDLVVSTFGEYGMSEDAADSDLIMHAQLTTADGHTIMASDTPPSMDPPTGRQQISISGDDDVRLTRYWESLSDGATVLEPLAEAPWGDRFGMLVDRWGVLWMVSIAPHEGRADASSVLDDDVATEGGHQDTAQQWHEEGVVPQPTLGHEDTPDQWRADQPRTDR